MQRKENQKPIRLQFEQIIVRRLLKCLSCPNAITPETNGFLLVNYNPRFLAGFCKSCWRNTPEKELESKIKAYFRLAVENAPARSFGSTMPALRGAEVKF